MDKKLHFCILKHLSKLFVLGLFVFLAGCNHGSRQAVNYVSGEHSSLLTIDPATDIPVIDGNSTPVGIYIHNNSEHTVNNISYQLINPTTQSIKNLDDSNCHSIDASSSCLLRFNSPKLSAGEMQSALVVAHFDNFVTERLVNFSYYKNRNTTEFSDHNLLLREGDRFNTVYMILGLQKSNIAITSSNKFITLTGGVNESGIVQGANHLVVPLEFYVPDNFYSLSRVQLTPVLNSNPNYSGALNIALTPGKSANILIGVIPKLDQNNPDGAIVMFNNGSQSATNISLVNNDKNIDLSNSLSHPCGSSLSPGEGCEYNVHLNNQMIGSGIANLVLGYLDGAGDYSATLKVLYFNRETEPLLYVYPQITHYTGNTKGDGGVIKFLVANRSAVGLDNISVQLTGLKYGDHTAIVNNTCSGALAGNSFCEVEVLAKSDLAVVRGKLSIYVTGIKIINGVGKQYNAVNTPLDIDYNDTTAPTVISALPLDSDNSASLNPGIRIEFSEPMNPATLNTSTIILRDQVSQTAIPLRLQEVDIGNSWVSFELDNVVLKQLTQYQLEIIPYLITDLAGNPVSESASQIVSSFSTADSNRPTITAFLPTNGSTNKSRTPTIYLKFSETVESIVTTNGAVSLTYTNGTKIPVTQTYDASTSKLTISVKSPLAENTKFNLRVNQNSITDLSGNTLGTNSNYLLSSFTTGDFTAPTVSKTDPVNGATNIDPLAGIFIFFSEPTTGFAISNIKLKDSNNTSVPISLAYDSTFNRISINPSSTLLYGETYRVEINQKAICDLAGNCLGSNSAYVYTTFTTTSVKRIFVSNKTFSGVIGGYAAADKYCNSDVNKPSGGGTYKALLYSNNAAKKVLLIIGQIVKPKLLRQRTVI